MAIILLGMLTLGSAAQETTGPAVTASVRDSLLTEVLRNWKREYNVRFAFDPEAVKGIRVSGEFTNEPMLDAMRVLLKNTPLDARQLRNTIVLFPRPPEHPTAPEAPVNREIDWNAIITDERTGEPLPFATARVDGTKLGGQCDEYGRISIRGIPADTCVIVINYIGYQELRANAIGGDDEPIRIQLRARQNILPSAVVEASGTPLLSFSDEPGLQSFNPSDLSQLGAGGETDILRGAQFLPGISATGESSSGLIIRGSDPDQALLIVDDFTIFHLDHFFGAFSAINADAVQHMNIRKGGLPARFGGRIGGVAEVSLREGNKYRPSWKLNVGSLSAGLSLGTPLDSAGKLSLMLTARRAFTDILLSPVFRNIYTTTYASGISGQVNSSDIFSDQNPPEFYYQDLTAKISWNINALSRISLSGYAGKDALQHRFRTSIDNSSTVNSYSDDNSWGNAGIGVRYTRDKGPTGRWLASIGFSRFGNRYFSADTIFNETTGVEVREYRNTTTRILNATNRIEYFKVRHQLEYTFGLQADLFRLEANQSGSEVADTSAVAESVVSPYFEWAKKNGAWKWSAGVRMPWYSGTSDVHPEPRFSVTCALNSSWLLKGTVGRVHQFIHRIRMQSLSLNDLDFWQLSGPGRVPVLVSDQITLGARWNKKQITIDAELWAKRNDGSFEYLGNYSWLKSSSSIITGNGYAYGLDVLSGWEKGRHHAWLAYAWSVSMNRFSSLDNPWVPESFDQRHEVKWMYEWEAGQWELSAAWVFGSGRPYTPYLGSYTATLAGGDTTIVPVYADLNAGRLPAYHRLDAAVTWNFRIDGVGGHIRFSLFNAYNRRNIRDFRYFGTGGENFPEDVAIQEVRMGGIMPAIQIQFRW